MESAYANRARGLVRGTPWLHARDMNVVDGMTVRGGRRGPPSNRAVSVRGLRRWHADPQVQEDGP